MTIIRELLCPLDDSGSVLPSVLDEVADVAELCRCIVETSPDSIACDSVLRLALANMLGRIHKRADLAGTIAGKATHRVLLDDAIDGEKQ
jgi:hypothetical protein